MKFKKSFMSSRRNQNAAVIKPQLTSLIDVMTILLVFLLKSFSVEGNLVTPSEDLVLPISTSKERPQPALNIEITQQSINLEGEVVATIPELELLEELKIEKLFLKLTNLAANYQQQQENHEVVIQCDKDMDFKIVKKVMYTCAQAKFGNFSILVREEE